jgi:transposase
MFREHRIDQVFLAIGTTDLRKNIDGLSILVQEKFKLDPFSRNLYVFCNRKRDKLKILEWSSTGFWLHYKRLEKDKFNWPDNTQGTHIAVSERSLRWLLDGLSVQEKAHRPVMERQII